MSLSEKLVESLHRAVLHRSLAKTIFTPVGMTLFFLSLVLCVGLFLNLDRLLGIPRFPPSPWNGYLSAPFLIVGCFFMLWSLLCFMKARGTPLPITPPPRLIVAGPYAFTRNPMMTGLFLFLFGLGILLKSPCVTLMFTPLFAAAMTLMITKIEEPELDKRFSEEYREYRQRVPRFFPRLPGNNRR